MPDVLRICAATVRAGSEGSESRDCCRIFINSIGVVMTLGKRGKGPCQSLGSEMWMTVITNDETMPLPAPARAIWVSVGRVLSFSTWIFMKKR